MTAFQPDKALGRCLNPLPQGDHASVKIPFFGFFLEIRVGGS